MFAQCTSQELLGWAGGPHGAAREEAGTSPSLLKMQHRDAQ